jgi:hypothetical protein
MNTRSDNSSRINPVPVLAALIVLCLGCAAVMTMLTHNAGSIAAPAELSFVVQRVPYEAQNALRGESSAFDALAKSAARLNTLRGALPDKGAGTGNAGTSTGCRTGSAR